MSESHSSSSLPPAALREFTRAGQADWYGPVTLAELLDRVNRVAIAMAGRDGVGRVKPTFTQRSLRHYQTLGCIDSPDKDGRSANYGYRHFVQALVIRRLLSDRVRSEQIVALLAGRDTRELERMFRGGVEIMARPGGDSAGENTPGAGSDLMEVWNRVRLAPGLELHVSSKLPGFKRMDRRRLIARLKEILRSQSK
jgi:DNA-binding transcriptional MerR regulator